ncbi:MarR family winged helix-turn-helix transcriptional regulator [Lacrimispora saccharolytica]|uniref:Transcriptional regulator, MarR family n=1 Tax=Lacrimispora saccharolytica (strain ATCC 35040 / DSM 2544 / NRCC 2533 / WM1) TaxID=610130 RepID=D9R2X2_LACSW|nr:MarR family transcriptional regulator [Lacrimispora saccharolytica]ADL02962.1 transcriptional regulator, MarR family [[Clostridium] saccharolyticum WM1]
MNEHREIGKYISILQRLNNMYFANQLSFYQIGCGQQFFLLQIYKNPGMSLHELASFGHYDKATATRAVKKLEEEGYVLTEMAKEDKRLRRIYVTDKAAAVVEKTLESVAEWADIILKGFTKEERDAAEQMLIRMAYNASHHIMEQKGKE